MHMNIRGAAMDCIWVFLGQQAGVKVMYATKKLRLRLEEKAFSHAGSVIWCLRLGQQAV